MTRHLALVGFMASGKSTVGRKLARKLGWPFFDTDAVIVRAHGPIGVIFSREGEEAFRRYEHAAICGVLENAQPSVVALGGGALTVPENRRVLGERAHCIFLKVAPEIILARVRRARELRPLLGRSPTPARIGELYAQRMPQYERADRVIEASRRSDADVIAEIAGWLEERKLGAGLAAP